MSQFLRIFLPTLIEKENLLYKKKKKKRNGHLRLLQEKKRLLQEKENERRFQLKMKELEMSDETKSAPLPFKR